MYESAWGAVTEYQGPGGLETTGIYFSWLPGWKSEIAVPAWLVLVGTLCQAAVCRLLMVSSHSTTRERAPWGLSYEGTNLIRESSSLINDAMGLGIVILTYKFGGAQILAQILCERLQTIKCYALWWSR